MELTLWTEQRGSAEFAGNVCGALQVIDRNEEFIKLTLAIHMPPNDSKRPEADSQTGLRY